MADNFEIPLTHTGHEFYFRAEFQKVSLIYCIKVDINGAHVRLSKMKKGAMEKVQLNLK
jgi:hypothetical protein